MINNNETTNNKRAIDKNKEQKEQEQDKKTESSLVKCRMWNAYASIGLCVCVRGVTLGGVCGLCCVVGLVGSTCTMGKKKEIWVVKKKKIG